VWGALARQLAVIAALGISSFVAVTYLTAGPRMAAGPEPVATVPAATAAPAATAPPQPTRPPPPSPSATPTPLPPAFVTRVYRSGDRAFTALEVRSTGLTFSAPFAGTVQVRVYQLVDGAIREGANVSSLPFFPYVYLNGADRLLTYRPGALDRDAVVLVQDGARVAAGDPLFRVVGLGASSWRTFYDASATFQVLVSLQALPSLAELDAAPLFVRP